MTPPHEATAREALTPKWRIADESELPERFTDPRMGEFLYVCSNGWEGTVTIGSAFIHKPARWPQCFPNGADSDATCTCILLREEADNDQ